MEVTEKTAADPHALDAERLADFLGPHLPEMRAPLQIERIQGGQSNPTYLLSANGHRWVLRKKPPGTLLQSAHMVEREHRVMKALHGQVPTPRTRVLCEDPSVIGTNFFVMDFVEGRIFRDTTLPGLSVAERVAIYDAMQDTMAALHKADWRVAGLEDFGKPAGYVRRQVARWSRQFHASKTHDIPAMDRLGAWLEAHAPEEDETGIAHGDFRLENMIFHPTEPRPLAVLDWELATIGHPLCDLGYNCMPYYLPRWMKGCGGFADIDISGLGIPDEKTYVARYCRLTGRESIPNWPYFLAFSMFRGAAILQGVYARSLQNNAAHELAREVGLYAAPVAEIGWNIANG
ncbi:phosphotransferase [Terrarubrum flagellatum]|uniref:phosphotransferase n=1 Tax=Terrirubrum flagellatum TaxID=2895980 RepID=UPI0031454C62